MEPEERPDRRRARLAWQCRRGMKELDVLLGDFLQHHYDGLAEPEQRAFETLLESPDPILLEYLMGHMVPIDREVAGVVFRIRRISGH